MTPKVKSAIKTLNKISASFSSTGSGQRVSEALAKSNQELKRASVGLAQAKQALKRG